MYLSALLSSEKKWNRGILNESNIFMHHTNYQKRMRLTFVDDYFGEKLEEKFMFLCIIHCDKKQFFKWLFLQVIQLFPLHIGMCDEYK